MSYFDTLACPWDAVEDLACPDQKHTGYLSQLSGRLLDHRKTGICSSSEMVRSEDFIECSQRQIRLGDRLFYWLAESQLHLRQRKTIHHLIHLGWVYCDLIQRFQACYLCMKNKWFKIRLDIFDLPLLNKLPCRIAKRIILPIIGLVLVNL